MDSKTRTISSWKPVLKQARSTVTICIRREISNQYIPGLGDITAHCRFSVLRSARWHGKWESCVTHLQSDIMIDTEVGQPHDVPIPPESCATSTLWGKLKNPHDLIFSPGISTNTKPPRAPLI
jgi:hypothetical protein